MHWSIAPQSSKQERREERSSHHRDALAEAEFRTLAEQQRRPEDLSRGIAEFADVCFRLSLDAAVEHTRGGIGADRTHEQELCCAGTQTSLRECDPVVVVDTPERFLRCRFFDRRAEATEHVIDVWEIGEGIEVDDSLLELVVTLRDKASADGNDAGPGAVCEQALQNVTAHEAGRAGE